MTNMIKLLQGDCLEIMKSIPDKSIDMILCDLPYGTTRCKWDSVIPLNHYGNSTAESLKIMVLFVYFLKCHLPQH